MSSKRSSKLLPRNVAAIRAGQDAAAAAAVTAGNPVSTRLESGIGNFFPGLECDLRNLERRFFPFLEIDTDFSQIVIRAVDLEGVTANAQALGAEAVGKYRTLAGDLRDGAAWSVVSIAGDFGPLGEQTVTLAQLTGESSGPDRAPPDAWTAIRLLKEGARVTLVLRRAPGAGQLTLSGPRMRYLDPGGALARMFAPGELTQSLCSPWTHDFRDCACFYWASNHPDIALPPLPDPPDGDPRWERPTAWERADRSRSAPPVASAAGAEPSPGAGSAAVREMAHHEINQRWQLLNFVVDRREVVTSYRPSTADTASPLPSVEALVAHLRYAAGVELAVMLEYLVAAWSLRKPAGALQALRDDLKASFAELVRIAVGEMQHLRAVNDVLAEITPNAFAPALAVASRVPDGPAGMFRPLRFRAALPEVIDDFIAIEAPSQSVDGLYSRILATLEARGLEPQAESIRTVISEGSDHWQTFLFIKEWLGRHPPAAYLIHPDPQPAPGGTAAQAVLQQRYEALLVGLDGAYRARLPAGAAALNAARGSMLGAGGIEGALDAVAAAGFLARFDASADPRFAPIEPP
jgi:hypothetical protein